MNVDSFLDTNILVYAATGHGAGEMKRQRALEILEDAELVHPVKCCKNSSSS